MDSSLWYYFWSEIDAEEDHRDKGISTLKLLASIGYTNALTALKERLGKNEETDKDESGVSTMLDSSSKEGDTDSWSDHDLTVWECELDEEGVLEVEYLKPPKKGPVAVRTELSTSDDDEESELIGGEGCVGYIYGGPEVENTRGWSRLGLLPDPWAEGRYPVIGLITPDDLNEDEVEPRLNMLTVSSGLTNFTLTPDEKGYGYTKLQLPEKGLANIDILKFYPYLQYVDLSNNKIEDISPLWEITHLVVLDVSNNQLTDSSIGKPEQILFLTYVNLSYNELTQVPDFSDCWSIKHFDLAHNKISEISALSDLEFLSYLNLSYNDLETIENLDNMLLREVHFGFNRITNWADPEPKAIPNLETINISYNQLSTLSIFTDMFNLTTLDVSYNNISRMTDFDALNTLPVLKDLKIAGNQITTISDAKRLIIFLVPSIERLDGDKITPMERVSAISLYRNSPLQDLICQHSRRFYYRHTLNPTVDWKMHKETGKHTGFILLIGDLGSSRKIIVRMPQKMNPHMVSAISRSKPLQHLICQHSLRFHCRHALIPTVGWERRKETGEHPGLIVLIGDIGSSRHTIVNMVQKMNPHICKGVRMLTTRPIAKYEVTNSRMMYVSLNRFNEIEKGGGFIVVERRYGHMYGIAHTELEDKHRVLLLILGMTAALELIWKGFDPTLIVMLPNQEEILLERCRYWFQASNVYSTKFNVNNSSTRKDTSTTTITTISKRGETRKDGHINSAFSTFSSVGKRKLPLKHRKKATYMKKCYRMYSSVKSKARKKKLGRLINSAEKNIILEEAYGTCFPQCLRGEMKNDWCNDPPLVRDDDVNSGIDESTSTSIDGIDDDQLRFVQNILRNQMTYIEMHIRNPGLFKLFISTDDLDKAAHTLLAMVEQQYQKLVESKKVKTVDMSSDPYYEQMVNEPIMKLIDEVTAYDLPLEIL